MLGKLGCLKRLSIIHLLLAIIFVCTGTLVFLIQGSMTLLLKPFRPNLYRRHSYYVTYILNSELVFLMEWWSGSRCVMYCDPDDLHKYFAKEPMFLVLNHSFDLDWLIGWLFCDHIGILGHSKIYGKKILKYVPIFGWCWQMQENIFLERNWQKDQISLEKQLERLASYPVPYLLTLLPEGTRFTREKHEVSMAVAQTKGLPPLKHLLLPRTRGFVASLKKLRKTLDAVYDVTIVFSSKCNPNWESTGTKVDPTVWALMNGKGAVGHLLVRRIPIEEVPEDDKGMADWLQKLFQHKDKCLDNFYRTGDFNPGGQLEELEMFKYKELPRGHHSLIIFLIICSIVVVFLAWGLWRVMNSGSYGQGISVLAVFLAVYAGLNGIINLTRVDKGSSYGGKGEGSKVT